MWATKKFNELSNKELFDIYKLRTAVFVVDQQRIYQEVDDNDLNSLHVFKYVDDKLVAYARIFLENNHVTFGRVVTDPDFRGTGLGKELINIVLDNSKKYFDNQKIEIEAQTYVEGFYKLFGFESIGEPFLFNHTPHIKMIKNNY